MDFGDLLMNTVRLFDGNQSLLAHYQELFRYILIDEYQDTNAAQYRMVRLLAGGRQNLCVVGDDDQSIYGWRGADLNNILSFEKDFPGTRVIRLEQNYRSTKKILRVASDLISRNQLRKGKRLWTENDEGEDLLLYRASDEKDEARFVVSEIQRGIASGRLKLNDFGIFYRVNAQSRLFEDELRSSGLPYEIFGGTRFYDRKEIKDLLAYFRVLINPKDSLSLKRILNVPPRGIGKKTMESLELYAERNQVPLREVLSHAESIVEVAKPTQKKLLEFGRQLDDWANRIPSIGFADLAKKILESSGYQEDLKSQETLEAENRLENLKEFLNVLGEFERSQPGGTILDFLEQVALIGDTDSYDPSQGRVPLMTLHLAKGLEFPVVFLVGMEEGLFPHSRSLDDPDEMEEERRLCYVGLTRAQSRIFISYAQKRRLYGGDQFPIPSRFLEEMPEEIVEKRSFDSDSLDTPEGDWSDPTIGFSQLPEEGTSLNVGTSVRHPLFGVGIVKRREGSGEQQKVTVYFRDGRVKTLVVKFAHLELV
jgi:DNA helicase-2/ATP-dependent DNA helicase PcrA